VRQLCGCICSGYGWRQRSAALAYFKRLISAKRSAQSSDMFSRLCHATSEEGDRLNDQEIIDHMIFLMMAAHDTTTSTLTSMTYELARNPAWQERIRSESFALGKDQMELIWLSDHEELFAYNDIVSF
jgi:cytochrome P450